MAFPIYQEAHPARGYVGQDADVGRSGSTQFHTSGDAVPVALSLVGHAVLVLSHAHVLNPVIHADGYLVVLSGPHKLRDVIFMRCG